MIIQIDKKIERIGNILSVRDNFLLYMRDNEKGTMTDNSIRSLGTIIFGFPISSIHTDGFFSVTFKKDHNAIAETIIPMPDNTTYKA